MFSKWRKKILPKWWTEFSEELTPRIDKGKICPFLTPIMVRAGIGVSKAIERECLQDRCELWDDAGQKCSMPVIAKLLRQAGD